MGAGISAGHKDLDLKPEAPLGMATKMSITHTKTSVVSMLVMTFLPRSKRLLISWLQSPSAVILEPKKIKSATVSTVYTSICHEMM